jgi:hypothetical protein
MKNDDLVAIWRHIRILHESTHRLGIAVDALQKISDRAGLCDQRLQAEKSLSQATKKAHEDLLGTIDGIIRKLMLG